MVGLYFKYPPVRLRLEANPIHLDNGFVKDFNTGGKESVDAEGLMN